ncbi:MAG: hypothetical protein KJN60_02100 [Boseongicola sp.]|nr:hypothetical protein [Boseongicola sp.]
MAMTKTRLICSKTCTAKTSYSTECRKDDFALRTYAPRDPARIRQYKAEIEVALGEGRELRREIPASAFSGLEGADANSRFEEIGDVGFEDFEHWLAKKAS